MIRNPVAFIGQKVLGGTSGSVLYIDSNTLLAQDNANLSFDAATDILTVTGAVTTPIINGGTGTGNTLSLRSNSTAWPRTSYITTDHLTIGANYAYPTGSAANLFAVVCSESITGIDVTNPAINTFQIAPSWTYTVGQAWGLVLKAALNFVPNVVSGVGAGGTDTGIYAGINSQPQLNVSSGSRTWANFWGLAVDPRNTGTSGTISAMIGIRNRGSITSGTTATNYYAITSDFSSVAGSTVGGYYGYSIVPSLAGTGTNFFGINISPTISGSMTTYDGVKITDSSAPTSATNIAFRHVGTNAHNRFQGKVRIGADSAPTFLLDVIETSTETSGTVTAQRITETLNPASSSTSTVYGLDIGINTSTGSSNPASVVNGQRILVNRNATDTGSIVTYRALSCYAVNNAILGTGQGVVTTLLEGAEFSSQDNSSTTTATTTIRGITVGVGISSAVVATRVFTTMDGIYVSNTVAAGSTLATITNLNTINCDVANTGTLNRTGTITNAIGLNVSGWTTAGVFGSGLTFTNAPEQIRLESMSISGSMGIRQRGSTPHNRFEGKTIVGADAVPDGFFELRPPASTGTVPVGFLMTVAAHTGLTANTERTNFKVTSATQQWATGTLSTQRFNIFDQPIISFVGASTCSTAYNLFAFCPSGGTNATITTAIAIAAGGTTVTNVTNSYGLSCSATTGATNNYSATFNGGNVGIGTLAPTSLLMFAAGTTTNSPIGFTAGTNRTTPLAGAVEYDGSRLFITSLGTATRQKLITSLLKDVTVITTNTTAAETTHYTTTLPGGTLGTDGGIRMRIMGHILNNKGSSGTVRYRVKYGGTTVYDATHTVATNANERGTEVAIWMTARNSASIQEINGESSVGAVSTIAGVAAAKDSYFMAHYHGLAVASASDQTLAFTITMNASSASFQVITDTVFLEYL